MSEYEAEPVILTREDELPRINISGYCLDPTSSDPKPPITMSDTLAPQDTEGSQNVPSTLGKPQARLAVNRLGAELDPQGAIWQLYQEESREHDKTLVDNRDKSLDVLLIYAGLFSSVLAGFVLDSKTSLQRDTSAISMDLLLFIARSQQHSAANNPQPGPFIESPSFAPAASVRLVNALWFLALVISLSTALMAMLAKEWLHHFIPSQSRPPHEHALLHQARVTALSRWPARDIIDILPTCLHLALLLFSIGLVVYLGQLDYIIASLVAILFIITFLIYARTTWLAATKEHCPYVTPVSKLLSKMCSSNQESLTDKTNKNAQGDPQETKEYKELCALDWLASNARDPAIKKCVYQALAGLSTLRPEDGACLAITEEHSALLKKMFDAALAQLPSFVLIKDQQISARRGTSMSKHVNALPKLVELLNAAKGQNTSKPNEVTSPHTSGNNPSTTLEMDQHQPRQKTPKLAEQALVSINRVWEEQMPFLPADAHTLFICAELRLIIASVRALKDEKEQSVHNEKMHEAKTRCSRVLFRAAIQLTSYSNNRVNISANSLQELLKALKETFECIELCPHDVYPMSTNYRTPMKGTSDSERPTSTLWTVVTGNSGSIYIRPTGIGDVDGLVVGLLQIIGKHDIRVSYELATAAREALHVVARRLLGQWLATMLIMHPEDVEPVAEGFNDLLKEWISSPDEHQPQPEPEPEPEHQPDPHPEPEFTEAYSQSNQRTTRELLILARIGLLCAGCRNSYMSYLSFEALQALCQVSKTPSGRTEFTEIMTYPGLLYHGRIHDITTKIIENSVQVDPKVVDQFLRLLFPEPVKHPRRELQDQLETLVCKHSECYDRLLKLWTLGTGLSKEFQRFMKEFENCCLSQWPLDSLFTSEDRIKDLLKLGEKEEHSPILANYFITWIKASFEYVDQSSKWVPWPEDRPFHHLLAMVTFVLDRNLPKDSHRAFLTSFLNASITYIYRDQASTPSLEEQIDVRKQIDTIRHLLQCNDNLINCREKDILVSEWNEYLNGIPSDFDSAVVSSATTPGIRGEILKKISDIQDRLLAIAPDNK